MNSYKKALSFLLAFVMVLGLINPAFAAGLKTETQINESKREIIAKNEDGNLVFDFSTNNRDLKTRAVKSLSTRRDSVTTMGTGTPGYNQNTVKVKIQLSGVNGKEFPFATIFPDGAKVKVETLNMETFMPDVKEKEFTSNGQELDLWPRSNTDYDCNQSKWTSCRKDCWKYE